MRWLKRWQKNPELPPKITAAVMKKMSETIYTSIDNMVKGDSSITISSVEGYIELLPLLDKDKEQIWDKLKQWIT